MKSEALGTLNKKIAAGLKNPRGIRYLITLRPQAGKTQFLHGENKNMKDNMKNKIESLKNELETLSLGHKIIGDAISAHATGDHAEFNRLCDLFDEFCV